MRIHSVTVLSCALFLLTLAGCPGSVTVEKPDLVPVEGTITLDGEPLVGASVMFGGVSVGHTDANGHYELSYQGTDKGAPAGPHVVVVEKWVMPDGSVYQDTEGISPMEAGATQQLPLRYAHTEHSQLKETVPAGGGTIDLELTSEPDSPSGAVGTEDTEGTEL